jgi:hypothetical protein
MSQEVTEAASLGVRLLGRDVVLFFCQENRPSNR